MRSKKIKSWEALIPSTSLDVNDVGLTLDKSFAEAGANIATRRESLRRAAQIVIDSAALCVDAKMSADSHMEFLRVNIFRIFEEMLLAPRSVQSHYQAFTDLGLDTNQIAIIERRNHANAANYMFRCFGKFVGQKPPLEVIEEIGQRAVRAGGFNNLNFTADRYEKLKKRYLPVASTAAVNLQLTSVRVTSPQQPKQRQRTANDNARPR